MKIKVKSLFAISIIVIIIVVIVTSTLNKRKKAESLNENYKYHTAEIIKIVYPGRSADYIVYKYNIREKTYTGTYTIQYVINNKRKYNELVGEIWPIVYDTTDFDNSKLLFVKQNYNGFDIDQKHIKYINLKK